MNRSRAIPTFLIVLSLALQGVASSRLLCPPQSIEALAPLRIACPPALWPFTDYPMYSEPHRRGDSLAWIEARIEIPDRPSRSLGLYVVERSPGETSFEEAFAREERRLAEELQSEVTASPRTAKLVFERSRLVLTEHGFVAR